MCARTCMFVRVWAHVCHGYRTVSGGLPFLPGLRQSHVYCCVCQAAWPVGFRVLSSLASHVSLGMLGWQV